MSRSLQSTHTVYFPDPTSPHRTLRVFVYHDSGFGYVAVCYGFKQRVLESTGQEPHAELMSHSTVAASEQAALTELHEWLEGAFGPLMIKPDESR
jgi:hypothetical protein